MAAPGFSVSEVIQVVSKLKTVYDAFFGKYDNASSRVRELADAIELFQNNLVTLEWILQRTGRHYPGHHAFMRTLQECEDFLHEHKALLDKKSKWPEKAWRTTVWPFEEERIGKLVRNLQTHSQAMGGFSLNLLLYAFLRSVRLRD